METKQPSTAVRRVGAVVAAVSVVATALLLPVLSEPAAAASAKVTICHRTHSTTNPYRRITVSQSAITRNAGHGDHVVPTSSTNPPVFSSTFSYENNNKVWGDVVPGGDADGTPYNGATNLAENWTVAGKAIFFSSKCAGMTAKQFYDTEIAAGVPESEVLADLNSQQANEDAALLAVIGSFTSANVSSWTTAVSVTTDPATAIASTTATLNGTLTVGNTSTVTGFDYGTDPTLTTKTSLLATPSPVTGTAKTVTGAATGLLPSTTYYVRVTGTTNVGTDTEGVLTGAIRSFTTLGPVGSTAQAITFVQPDDMVLGAGTQALTVDTASPSDLPVTFTSTTTEVCTVAGTTVTAVAAGTCSINAT